MTSDVDKVDEVDEVDEDNGVNGIDGHTLSFIRSFANYTLSQKVIITYALSSFQA